MSSHWVATKTIQGLRNFLAGRTLAVANRYKDQLSARTQPDPNLKDGPAHKLNNNYYVSRDLRRASQPPIMVFSHGKLIESGEKSAESQKLSTVTPGDVYVPKE